MDVQHQVTVIWSSTLSNFKLIYNSYSRETGKQM